LSAQQRAEMENLIGLSNGLVLFTGPTGSGKTTSLYAALARLNTEERKIITLHFGLTGQDPVTLERIGQTFDPPISRERVRQIEERAFGKIRDRRRTLLSDFIHKDRP